MNEKRLPDAMINVPGDFKSLKRVLEFYGGLAKRGRSTKWLLTTHTVLAVIFAFAGIVMVLAQEENFYVVGVWIVAAICVFNVLGVCISFNPLQNILPYLGLAVAAWVGIANFQINSQLIVASWSWHLDGFLAASFFIWNATAAFRLRRLSTVLPDPEKIQYISETYVPLFEGITTSARDSVRLGLFKSPTFTTKLPRGDRYITGHQDTLFSATIPLSQESSLAVEHTRLRGEVYKYRKGKFKGSRGMDKVSVTWTGLGTLTEQSVGDSLRKTLGITGTNRYGLAVKKNDDKMKISLFCKAKSQKSASTILTLPSEAVQMLLGGISDLHSRSNPPRQAAPK